MALKPKPVTALDRACSLLLQELVDRSGLSQQKLATATGISQNRVGIILRGERAASVGEIAKLAECVATTAASVVAEAEARISEPAPSASAPGSDGSGVGNVARLDFGRSKSRVAREDLEELEPFA
ncbi:helix-turn-helix domain-containing protein [Varibaculum cambriense]|uniref:helix-turn-helix domain-containing protein n=1 Tax=Varibaculum cambriense TaxID=184870 RepID=UPI0025523A99|nr:helix-turn-helix transcriptional regulator [Varibaculum cambriense]MDK8274425.1 helix-turn-helix transcriptional regulator [Varibaculum cambriense]